MATETSDGTEGGVSSYVRSVTVTTVATLLGIGAGTAAAFITTAPDDTTGLLVLAAAVVIQLPLYRVVGIDVSDFGTKDYLYIAFMTFTLWFITWGILMTAGTV
jgi:hypothetical protein